MFNVCCLTRLPSKTFVCMFIFVLMFLSELLVGFGGFWAYGLAILCSFYRRLFLNPLFLFVWPQFSRFSFWRVPGLTFNGHSLKKNVDFWPSDLNIPLPKQFYRVWLNFGLRISRSVYKIISLYYCEYHGWPKTYSGKQWACSNFENLFFFIIRGCRIAILMKLCPTKIARPIYTAWA